MNVAERSPGHGNRRFRSSESVLRDVCHLAASAGSDGEAPAAAVADAAPFSAVAAVVFVASAASDVRAVAPSAAVSVPAAAVLTGWLFAASCADVPGPASVEASAVPDLASGTSCSTAAGIFGPPSDSQSLAGLSECALASLLGALRCSAGPTAKHCSRGDW